MILHRRLTFRSGVAWLRLSIIFTAIELVQCTEIPADVRFDSVVLVDRSELATWKPAVQAGKADPLGIAITYSVLRSDAADSPGGKVILGNVRVVFCEGKIAQFGMRHDVYEWPDPAADQGRREPRATFIDIAGQAYRYQRGSREESAFNLAKQPQDLCLSVPGAVLEPFSDSRVVRVPAARIAEALLKPAVKLPPLKTFGLVLN